MTAASRGRWLTGATFVAVAAISASSSGQTQPPADRVAKLNDRLATGARTLQRDARTGYLSSVLEALGVPVESQLLVFSKTGIQREFTSPQNPRALYFNESVVVGYNPGAPALEVAVHDAQQGIAFYTLDQAAAAPTFTRRTNCLTCHVSESTLNVPGLIDRSNMVDRGGTVIPSMGSHAVDHRTPHTQRWGGWFVTTYGPTPPYQQFGHLGNLTTAGPQVISDHVFVEWINSAPETRGYLSSSSDLGAMLVFNHQTHAVNLMTKLSMESPAASIQQRVGELADYLLFVGEAPTVVAVTPRPGFSEQLEARAPKDRQGRSLAQLDLTKRLLRYPCSYMIYSEAFDELPQTLKQAVYSRMFDILSGKDRRAKYAQLSAADRRAVLEILRDTKQGLPQELR